MNPFCSKPQADRTAQLIVHGQVRGTLGADNFRDARRSLLPEVMASYARLEAQCDLVVVEGAGSPAEINLRAGDIANMGFARAAQVPVVLVGDIDRGGVIAAIVGTRAVLDADDAAMIRGFVINKFRGDPALFADGYAAIESAVGLARIRGRCPGSPPPGGCRAKTPWCWSRGAGRAPARKLVVCPILPRIANFDDLDPLKLEPDIEVAFVAARRADPGRSRARRPARLQGDDRRPGGRPRIRMGHRHSRPSPPRRGDPRASAAATRC